MPVAAPPMPDAAVAQPFFGKADDAGTQRSNGHNGETAGWYVASNGRLIERVVVDGDRQCAMATHLSPLAFFWIGPFALAIPLILWLVRKDHSRFADDHGRESVNFVLSLTVLHLLLPITIIGIIFLPVLWIVGIVSMIRGAVAANRHEYFRYPMTIRFL